MAAVVREFLDFSFEGAQMLRSGSSGKVIYVNPEKGIVVAVASYCKPTVLECENITESIPFLC